MSRENFSIIDLRRFISKADDSTYAGNGQEEDQPERLGFTEFTYSQGDWFYRDSYTGFLKARGMTVVRYKNKPVWTSAYGGAMVENFEDLAGQTFTFLKTAMKQKEEGFDSIRGPHLFEDGDWKYTYKQDGNLEEFSGLEQIYHKEHIVFFHRIIGGLIQE